MQTIQYVCLIGSNRQFKCASLYASAWWVMAVKHHDSKCKKNSNKII